MAVEKQVKDLLRAYVDFNNQIRSLAKEQDAVSKALSDLYVEENPIPPTESEALPKVREQNLVCVDGNWFALYFDCESGKLEGIRPSDINVLGD